MDIHSIDWSATPWEPVREGVERKAFSGEGATVSLNRLQPGHEPRPHDHPHEQIVYILAGQIDFHVGETVTRLGPGGLLGRAAQRPPLGRRGGRRAGAQPRRLHAQARRVRGLTTRAKEGLRMTTPNTLIFVDLASDDPAAAGKFYAEVFGWRDDERPLGVFHRMVPGGNFINPGRLGERDRQPAPRHLQRRQRPPASEPGRCRAARAGRRRPQGAGLDPGRRRPVARGHPEAGAATAARRCSGRDHYWKEFNGFNHAFRDPWGNEIILWVKGGADPQIPPNYTRE